MPTWDLSPNKALAKLLHTCITLAIVKQHLVQIGRIDGPNVRPRDNQVRAQALILDEKGIASKKSGNEVYCTNALLLLRTFACFVVNFIARKF